MTDSTKRCSGTRDDDTDDRHLFWYWLPVAGAGVCLTFLAWERLFGF